MKVELKQKELFDKIFKLANPAVGGRVEVKPGIFLEVPGKLDFSFIHNTNGFSVVFPKTKVKVVASKWMFQLDGYINKVDVFSDKVLVDIEGMPDLEIYII